MQTNLYKCFLPQAWMFGSLDGVSGFLHPKGGGFREEVYSRLHYHFQFQNELNMFAEVNHHAKFSVNVFADCTNRKVSFLHLANLYVPSTVDQCFKNSGQGTVPGIKDENNKWNIKGHKQRIVLCTDRELALFAQLYDAVDTPALAARLPAVHSKQIVGVLKKFADQPRKLGDLKGGIFFYGNVA